MTLGGVHTRLRAVILTLPLGNVRITARSLEALKACSLSSPTPWAAQGFQATGCNSHITTTRVCAPPSVILVADVQVQRIRGFGDNALYKSTFYLLTYLLTDDQLVAAG